MEGWRSLTTAGKVLAIAFFSAMGIAVLVVFAVMISMSKGRSPPWAVAVLATAILHYGSLGGLAGYMVRLKQRMEPQNYEQLSDRVGATYISIILCFWNASAIIALISQPSCNPDSAWWKALDTLTEEGPREWSMASICTVSLVTVALVITNALLTLGVLLGTLLFSTDKGKPAPVEGFLQRLFPKPIPDPSDLEVERLLDQLEA
ncbi:hypothetical protein CALCODRAFT_503568 [Calocera cornea HHB12733]|uniref:Uncharacterized protein n=1 Tax=Calocera cornea HHB12733 TaxID=1353952 RepID=A0A165CUV7_9BASI|nr:hypothetical protein CALCODRAFT_503568 [Calocera cornea HHB12733]